MPTVVSISAKQKTAADKFGNTNFKRVGPNTAKNRLKSTAAKKVISNEKTVKTVKRVPTVMENMLAMADRRAAPHQRKDKKEDVVLNHYLPYLSGNIQVTVITNGATEAIKEKLGFRGTMAQLVVEQLGINAKSKGIKVVSE